MLKHRAFVGIPISLILEFSVSILAGLLFACLAVINPFVISALSVLVGLIVLLVTVVLFFQANQPNPMFSSLIQSYIHFGTSFRRWFLANSLVWICLAGPASAIFLLILGSSQLALSITAGINAAAFFCWLAVFSVFRYGHQPQDLATLTLNWEWDYRRGATSLLQLVKIIFFLPQRIEAAYNRHLQRAIEIHRALDGVDKLQSGPGIRPAWKVRPGIILGLRELLTRAPILFALLLVTLLLALFIPFYKIIGQIPPELAWITSPPPGLTQNQQTDQPQQANNPDNAQNNATGQNDSGNDSSEPQQAKNAGANNSNAGANSGAGNPGGSGQSNDKGSNPGSQGGSGQGANGSQANSNAGTQGSNGNSGPGGDTGQSGTQPGGSNPGSAQQPGTSQTGDTPGQQDQPGGTNPGTTQQPGSGQPGDTPGQQDQPGGTNPGTAQQPGPGQPGDTPGQQDQPGGTTPGSTQPSDQNQNGSAPGTQDQSGSPGGPQNGDGTGTTAGSADAAQPGGQAGNGDAQQGQGDTNPAGSGGQSGDNGSASGSGTISDNQQNGVPNPHLNPPSPQDLTQILTITIDEGNPLYGDPRLSQRPTAQPGIIPSPYLSPQVQPQAGSQAETQNLLFQWIPNWIKYLFSKQ